MLAKQLKLYGKVALVTGGARSLGRAYALRLASLGAELGPFGVTVNCLARAGS